MHSAHSPQQVTTIIIGAGQAGLSMSYCLTQDNIDHIILEKSARVANNWRDQRWDSFCLVTPNWQCQLPGHPYNGEAPDGFMVKDEIIAYLEHYVSSFKPTIHFNSPVNAVTRRNNRFFVETDQAQYIADEVVVACGSYHRPRLPGIAEALPASIQQVHSSRYKNPQQLAEGAVLVVGTGQSGCQIAEDLHLAGRQVHLCVGSAPRVNRRYRGKDVVRWLDDMGYYQTTIHEHPDGKRAAKATNHYVTGRDGGRDINLRMFAEQGMRLHGRLLSADGAMLHLGDDLHNNLDHADAVAARIVESIEDYINRQGIDAPADDNQTSSYQPPQQSRLDLEAEGITSIIWATGFEMDFSWIQLPVTDAQGYPIQSRGVSPIDDLYFLGLNWMYTWGSGRFYQVGRDAEYLNGLMRTKRQMAAAS